MLTPHRQLPTSSADLVPGLALVDEVFDARVMGPRLASALGRPGRGRRPAAGWHVVDAKYEPGVRCTVLYRAGDLLVRGDLLDGTDIDAAPGPVVDPGVRLSPFPGDPDLPTLAAAADPASLREALRAALPGGAAILRCRVDLLRYRPAKRATFAVEARAHPGRSGRQPQRLVVKCYHDGRKAAAVAEEAVLLDATADAGAPLRFAAVRAHLPELSLVVQDRVAGVPLPEVLRRPGPAPAAALRRAARALAALHRQPVVSRRTRDVDAELARFRSRGRRVAAVAPATGAALVELATRLAATAKDVPEGVVALVHGDCKASQFLLADGGKVALLDLDSCGRADPAGDVGTFLATLRQSGLRPTAGRPAAASAALAQRAFAELFLREYLQAAAAAPDVDLRRRIAWYEAVALERKALRTFARAPRSPLTRALVAEGHRCLDALGGIR